MTSKGEYVLKMSIFHEGMVIKNDQFCILVRSKQTKKLYTIYTSLDRNDQLIFHQFDIFPSVNLFSKYGQRYLRDNLGRKNTVTLFLMKNPYLKPYLFFCAHGRAESRLFSKLIA